MASGFKENDSPSSRGEQELSASLRDTRGATSGSITKLGTSIPRRLSLAHRFPCQFHAAVIRQSCRFSFNTWPSSKSMQFQKQRGNGDGATMTLFDETAGDTSDLEEAKILQKEIVTCNRCFSKEGFSICRGVLATRLPFIAMFLNT